MNWIRGIDEHGGDIWICLDNVTHVTLFGHKDTPTGKHHRYEFHSRDTDRPATAWLRRFDPPPQIIPAYPGFVKLTLVPPDKGPVTVEHIERSAVIAWRYRCEGEPPDPIGTDEWGDNNVVGFIDPISQKIITYGAEFQSIEEWVADLNAGAKESAA